MIYKTTQATDTHAEQINFGIEFETTIPNISGVQVGGYHRGTHLTHGRAPRFQGNAWKAERDGSIVASRGRQGCEFVSPILKGFEGVQNVKDFTQFMDFIGARVNSSCGLHITIGIDSVIGTAQTKKRIEFAQKFVHIVKNHSKAIFAQTGTCRHLNRFSAEILDETETALQKALNAESDIEARRALYDNTRYQAVNISKVISHGVIEVRAFAGTTSFKKVVHHLACVLGIAVRAAELKRLPKFKKNAHYTKHTETGLKAVDFLHVYLGWKQPYRFEREKAYGVIPGIQNEMESAMIESLRLANKWEERFGSRATNL